MYTTLLHEGLERLRSATNWTLQYGHPCTGARSKVGLRAGRRAQYGPGMAQYVQACTTSESRVQGECMGNDAQGIFVQGEDTQLAYDEESLEEGEVVDDSTPMEEER
ncbi:hypothetical protein NDU88_004502 [Pleurodeles waltl]|uniref:Uncharacterized protein n=1 Tax=Pleurodeles waltl TaxID=8319 RepID=A0AAV7T9S6_PLEWA|nr:hypothetical protein NDU88_004502 [Pleurodeles waltl]